ncbi:MAG: hypothetical protein RLZZ536_839, partial [Planctomycetota bacterium]
MKKLAKFKFARQFAPEIWGSAIRLCVFLNCFSSTLFKVHNMSKSAFITGITGQDGSYLAELLLEKG